MKYYAVRAGLDGPKIYESWVDCQKAVKGFKGAQFKSFTDENEAKLYITTVSDVLRVYPEGHHIMVDAANSQKENTWEFRAVWSDTKELIFQSPVYKNGTNNTGEVLGLATAIKYRSENDLTCNIYCDSMTAISACEKGTYKMVSKNINYETVELVLDALKETRDMDRGGIIHYNNKIIGIEIPADFGRK